MSAAAMLRGIAEPGDTACADVWAGANPAHYPVAIFDDCWSPTLTFAYSLGRQGIPLHFYGQGAGRWSRYCTRRERCPRPGATDEFLPWLEARLRSGTISRIAPTTDLICFYMSLLRDLFPAEVRRSIAPLEEIEGCLIKSRFATRCMQLGCATPETESPDSLDDAIRSGRRLGYPLMMKPKSHLVVGFAERGHVVKHEAELRASFRPYAVAPGQRILAERYPELRWPLLQRYLPSARTRVYSVTGVRDPDSGTLTAAVSYKSDQWPPDVGTSTRQVACTAREVLAAGLAVVEKLISSGVFELELVSTSDGELQAIDLNPRGFGFIALDLARGQDLPLLWLKTTVGPVAPRALNEFVEPLEAMPPAVAFLKYVRGMGRAVGKRQRTVSMLGHLGDPLPMLWSNLAYLRHPRSLLRAQIRALRAPELEQA